MAMKGWFGPSADTIDKAIQLKIQNIRTITKANDERLAGKKDKVLKSLVDLNEQRLKNKGNKEALTKVLMLVKATGNLVNTEIGPRRPEKMSSNNGVGGILDVFRSKWKVANDRLAEAIKESNQLFADWKERYTAEQQGGIRLILKSTDAERFRIKGQVEKGVISDDAAAKKFDEMTAQTYNLRNNVLKPVAQGKKFSSVQEILNILKPKAPSVVQVAPAPSRVETPAAVVPPAPSTPSTLPTPDVFEPFGPPRPPVPGTPQDSQATVGKKPFDANLAIKLVGGAVLATGAGYFLYRLYKQKVEPALSGLSDCGECGDCD